MNFKTVVTAHCLKQRFSKASRDLQEGEAWGKEQQVHVGNNGRLLYLFYLLIYPAYHLTAQPAVESASECVTQPS